MEQGQAEKFVFDLLRMMLSKNASDLLSLELDGNTLTKTIVS